MSKVYVRVFENAKIHKAQNGHLRANIINIRSVKAINQRVRAELHGDNKS